MPSIAAVSVPVPLIGLPDKRELLYPGHVGEREGEHAAALAGVAAVGGAATGS